MLRKCLSPEVANIITVHVYWKQVYVFTGEKLTKNSFVYDKTG